MSSDAFGTFNYRARLPAMVETSVTPPPGANRHPNANRGAYIVTMRNKSGSPEAYFVTGRDEQHAIDRAARIAGLRPGQVIGITPA